MRRALLLSLLVVLAWDRPAAGYSLLTHEQLIDLAWQDSIVPLLLSHYPGLTPAQLDEARAYAYGGCVIQDLGYYPFGDASFSDLTHYVRSGDFVVSLLRNAKDADELAFAVGALSHYIGDSVGHPLATNRAVAIEFPKLQAKYGAIVNYAEGQHQHVQTEFAFDIDEIAHHRVAPLRFLRHIGLQVPTKQLALAYYQTYGLQEDFTSRRKRRFNVRNYRFAVRTFIPRIAYAVTLLHRHNEPPEPDTAEYKEIVAETAAVDRENNWDAYRTRAGVESHFLAALLYVLPKIGPLKLVAVKGPTTATESDYMHSLLLSITIFRHILGRFTPPPPGGARDGHASPPPAAMMPILAATSPDILLRSHDPEHPLPNRDLDTGYVVRPGGYRLTDSTYAALLHRLIEQPAQPIPPGIKKDVQNYYSDPNSPISTKKDPQRWAQVQADLTVLASMATSNAPEPYPTYRDEAEDAQ
jgi:hypothetical protein